jgi:hypothetical protein
MVARRMLTFLVLLLVVTALSAGLLAPPPRTKSPPAVTPVPERERTAFVEHEMDAGDRRPSTVTVRSGDLLSLTVSAQSADAVEVEGLSALRAVAPETPVTFDVLADVPGEYPVVLVGEGRTVGTVRVLSRPE